MIERPLLVSGGLVTQSADAIVELLSSIGRPADPLPEIVDLGTVKLVRSTKGEAYYCVTEKACSCPSFIYRGGPCKHQKTYFAESKRHGQTIAETLKEHDKNLHKMPKSYQRMVKAFREYTEAVEDVVPEEQYYKAICKSVSDKELAAKRAAAKAKSEANRQQARAHQARQREANQRANPSIPGPSIIKYNGFKPIYPGDEPNKKDDLAEEAPGSQERIVLLSIIDAFDTTPAEVAYWEHKEHQEV